MASVSLPGVLWSDVLLALVLTVVWVLLYRAVGPRR